MENCAGTQGFEHDQRVHVLEEQVAWIEVGAQRLRSGDRAQPLERARVVDRLAGVHLDSDAHAVL